MIEGIHDAFFEAGADIVETNTLGAISVAQSDYALLEVRFYHVGALEAYKIAHMPRAQMEDQNGHRLPRLIIFRDLDSGTRTEIHARTRLVNPPLDDGLFTKTTLESRRRLLRSEPLALQQARGE